MQILIFFLGWIAGMGACWLLWDARETLQRRRRAADLACGEREAHEELKRMGAELTAAKANMPAQAPPNPLWYQEQPKVSVDTDTQAIYPVSPEGKHAL